MDILFSVLILTVGIVVALFYLRKPPLPENPRLRELMGDRPWRRIGAAICLLLAVMFVLGIHLLDQKAGPRVFVFFWLIIMALLVWLCVLAIKDVLYTRNVIAGWKTDPTSPLDGGRQPGPPPGTTESQGSENDDS